MNMPSVYHALFACIFLFFYVEFRTEVWYNVSDRIWLVSAFCFESLPTERIQKYWENG